MGLFDHVDPVLYYLGLSGTLKYALHWLWKDKIPKGSELVGHISALNLYPLKSGRNIPVDILLCSSEKGAHNGYIADRHFMVITNDNKMVTGRQEPKVLGIICKLNMTKVTLTAQNMPDCVLDTKELDKKTQNTVDVVVHLITTKGVDCGQGAADWLTQYLGSPHRLLYSAPNIQKRKQMQDLEPYLPWTKEAKDNDLLAFHDSIAFHLCTEESLADLNKRLENPVGMERFRPNMVAKTTCQPYEEDDWIDISIGEARFKKIKCADRCVMPTIDPYKCYRDRTNEPQKTLKSYRSKLPGFGPLFGLDMVVEKPGTIRVGDPIYVTKQQQ